MTPPGSSGSGLGKRAGRREPGREQLPKGQGGHPLNVRRSQSACEVKVQAASLTAEEVDRLGDVVEGSG